MRNLLHNPALRFLMLVLVVFLAWPCAGDCGDYQMSGIALASAHSAPAAPCITVAHHLHGCGCPCLSDSVKVGAQMLLYVPPLLPTLPVAALEPPQPSTIAISFRDDTLPPKLRPARPALSLRAPPLV